MRSDQAMPPIPTPYVLPEAAKAALFAVAETGDVLVLGEVHGTQEVPRLALGLLPQSSPMGYDTLALEIYNHEQEAITAWATEQDQTIPNFFAHPNDDGRGNEQVLALIREATAQGWAVLCFDLGAGQITGEHSWQERDAQMARNLIELRRQRNLTGKVLAICGNLHARVTPPTSQHPLSDLWPSFAAVLQEQLPTLRVNSVDVIMHEGTFFNQGQTLEFHLGPLASAEMRRPDGCTYTAELHLPRGTVATFLAMPDKG